jgi:hypothetical protein
MFGIRQGPKKKKKKKEKKRKRKRKEKCYVTKREIIVIPRKAEALNGNLKKHKT